MRVLFFRGEQSDSKSDYPINWTHIFELDNQTPPNKSDNRNRIPESLKWLAIISGRCRQCFFSQ